MKNPSPLLVSAIALGAFVFSPTSAQDAGWVDVRQVPPSETGTQGYVPRTPFLANASAEYLIASYKEGDRRRPQVKVLGVISGSWAYSIWMAPTDPYLANGIVFFRDDVRGDPGLDRLWSIDCDEDRMDDTFVCWASKPPLSIAFWINRQGNLSLVCSLSHDFPGRNMRYRIDRQRPVTVPNGVPCVEAAPQLASISAASRLLLESYAFPDDTPIVEEIDLAGLREVRTVMQALELRRGRIDWMGREHRPPDEAARSVK